MNLRVHLDYDSTRPKYVLTILVFRFIFLSLQNKVTCRWKRDCIKKKLSSFGYTLTQLDLILDLVIITNTIKRIHNRPITIVLVELSMFKHAYTIYDFSNLRGKQIAA